VKKNRLTTFSSLLFCSVIFHAVKSKDEKVVRRFFSLKLGVMTEPTNGKNQLFNFLVVIWSRLRIRDHFSTSLSIAE